MDGDSEPEIEQNAELEKYLGKSSFGKQSQHDRKEATVKKQVDATKRQVADNAPSRKRAKDSDDDSDDDDDDDDDDEDEYPVSHEMVLKTHEKAVTAVTLDPAGGRLVTGSMDSTLKFHDFTSMTPTTIRAFRSVDPTPVDDKNTEGHPVNQVIFNPLSAGHILATTGLPQAKILSRDGETLVDFIKGDMYLRDMHNTKGHISEVTSGTWHPTDRNVCVTAGSDSTLRIWDINNSRGQKEVIVHKSKTAGNAGRSRMTAVAWGSPVQGGNNILIGTALDGTMSMWSGEGPHHRPAAEIRDAHQPNTWTSGVDISADGRLVVTRGGDDTIKTWDTRKFKEPIVTIAHASTSAQYAQTSIRFSPNSSSIITGSETGDLHILNYGTLRPELVTPITPGSALICAIWHPKINQIVTGSANGETHVLYNPNTSTAGANFVMSRAPKKRHVDDDPNFTTDLSNGISNNAVILPGGSQPSATSYAARHPNVGLTASGRSRDPRRPHVPQSTPFAKNNPDEDYVKKEFALSSMRDEDPREALLKYADKAKNDPLFTNAYKETQPDTIYREASDDEDEPDKKKQRH